MAGVGIKFRWDPSAVDYLLDLEDQGLTDVSQRILGAIRERLGQNPGIYRFVRITGVPLERSRRLTVVQRLFLGSELPYLVYYRFRRADDIVEILRIRHARQKPIER